MYARRKKRKKQFDEQGLFIHVVSSLFLASILFFLPHTQNTYRRPSCRIRQSMLVSQPDPPFALPCLQSDVPSIFLSKTPRSLSARQFLRVESFFGVCRPVCQMFHFLPSSDLSFHSSSSLPPALKSAITALFLRLRFWFQQRHPKPVHAYTLPRNVARLPASFEGCTADPYEDFPASTLSSSIMAG